MRQQPTTPTWTYWWYDRHALVHENSEASCPTCNAAMDYGARYCGSCGSAIAPTGSAQFPSQVGAATPEMIGRDVGGRYRILAKLGEGGMGAVYRAEQISLKRIIALKVLKPELSAEPGLVRRFNAEATLAAKLNHPNTVTLYDFGQDDDGSLFIAMEYIEGKSLRQVLVKDGPLAPDRLLAITTQICGSLSDAHATGIVHRDLKPDNVMLFERGKQAEAVSVLDFGIAKLRDEHGNITQQPMTQAGDILGTPQYMAPEQIRGDRVDARTDIYALGVMLYEMVTARLPFEGATVMALLSKHLTDTPVAPTARRPELAIPEPISQLIMWCLAKSPADRPSSMDEVEQFLAPMMQSHSVAARTPQASSFQPLGVAPQAAAMLAEAPTGYASNHNGQPPGQPTPTAMPPQLPIARVPGSRTSRMGTWLVVGVILLGSGGAGAYALLTSDKEAPETDEFNMSAWENNEDVSPSEDSPDELGEDEDNSGATQIYTDTAFNYRMQMPAHFTGGDDRMGMATYSGSIRGHNVQILTQAWPTNSNSETDLEFEVATHLAVMDVVIETMRWQDGRTLVGDVASPGEGLHGEFVASKHNGVLFLAAIGSPMNAAEATKKFRRKFLREDYEFDF